MKVLEMVEQEDGSALMELDTTIVEYAAFVKIGFKALGKTTYDDRTCFQEGVLYCLRKAIDYEKLKLDNLVKS